MAINLNLPNPYQLPIVESPYKDMFSNALKSYQSGIDARFAPYKAKEEQQERLADILNKNITNKYLPQEKELGIEKSKLGITESQLDIDAKRLSNVIQERTGMPAALADLKSKELVNALNAQKYQQAEQMNPLEVAEKRFDVQNQPSLSALKEELLRAQIEKNRQLQQTPYQKEIMKGRAKHDVEVESTASNAVLHSSEVLGNLYEIKNAINANPTLSKAALNPGAPLNKILGSKETQDLLGQVEALSGNIMLSEAHNLKGAFTGRDQTLINRIKPNATDTYDVFMAKTNALIKFNELIKKRSELIVDYMTNQGMTSHEAIKKALEQTQPDIITKNYNISTKTVTISPNESNDLAGYRVVQ